MPRTRSFRTKLAAATVGIGGLVLAFGPTSSTAQAATFCDTETGVPGVSTFNEGNLYAVCAGDSEVVAGNVFGFTVVSVDGNGALVMDDLSGALVDTPAGFVRADVSDDPGVTGVEFITDSSSGIVGIGQSGDRTAVGGTIDGDDIGVVLDGDEVSIECPGGPGVIVVDGTDTTC